MKFSVIICTHNRAKLLHDTIESFFLMEGSTDDDIELILVDNASEDDTRLVVERWMEKYRNIRYEFEPLTGLSHARNHGIAHATGEVLAFVDDDVFFSSSWLAQLKETFSNLDVACMGGKSIPIFEDEEPNWLTDDILFIYGSTCSGNNVKPMHYPEHPFGLNMAFRKEVFQIIGLFNPRLGRKGSNLLSNEESELFWRIHHAGINVIYNPNAIIYHRIPKELATLKWVLRRYYWQGRSEAVLDRLIHGHSRLKMIKNSWNRLTYLFKSTLRGIPLHPRRAYWQLVAMPLSKKCLWYSMSGYIQQCFIEISKLTYEPW